MNQQNQIEFHHLPSEILIHIFHLLNFRQRIRLERVCRIWRQAVLPFAWFEVRTLKVTDRVKNRQCSRPSRSLAKLSAILRRCGPHLEELYLGPGIGVHTRFGRYFRHLAVHQKLAHLRIDDSLDIWHLQQIAQHLAPQLISLSLNLCPISRKNRQNRKQKLAKEQAWINLLANCQKLECLRITELDDLFNVNGEGQLIALLPKSVKYLQIWYEEQWNWEGNKESNKVKFQMLLNEELFPKLRFFLNNSYFELDEMLSNKAKLYDRFYSLQWPMLYAQNHSFLQLDLPNFRHLQALHLNCNIDHLGLIQLAQYCPQLEHLDFKAHYAAGWGFDAPMRELEGLYAFNRLSSLAISIELRHFENFDKLKCTTGEFADHFLMEIITNLNQIHPLRSLDFKAAFRHIRYYPNFREEFVLELLKKLSHLETFSCAIEPHECYFCLPRQYPHNPFHPESTCWSSGGYRIEIDLDEFFSKLQIILNEQMERGIKQSKTFKFTLLKFHGRGVPHSRITAKWNPNTRKISWKNIPVIRKFDYQIYPAYSIVLDELLDKVIDKRTRRMLLVASSNGEKRAFANQAVQLMNECLETINEIIKLAAIREGINEQIYYRMYPEYEKIIQGMIKY